MLPNRSNDTGMPRIASDRKVMKTTEEGENRKGGRIGDDGVAGGRWRHGEETMEHKGKNRTKGNPNFHKQQLSILLHSSPFIEIRCRGREE